MITSYTYVHTRTSSYNNKLASYVLFNRSKFKLGPFKPAVKKGQPILF